MAWPPPQGLQLLQPPGKGPARAGLGVMGNWLPPTSVTVLLGPAGTRSRGLPHQLCPLCCLLQHPASQGPAAPWYPGVRATFTMGPVPRAQSQGPAAVRRGRCGHRPVPGGLPRPGRGLRGSGVRGPGSWGTRQCPGGALLLPLVGPSSPQRGTGIGHSWGWSQGWGPSLAHWDACWQHTAKTLVV